MDELIEKLDRFLAKILVNYLCCCILKKERKKFYSKTERELSSETIHDDELKEPEKNIIDDRENAAIRIQKVFRGFIERSDVNELRERMIQEASEYWVARYNFVLYQRQLKLAEIQARKILTMNYVADIFDASLMFMGQISEATSVIQRTWRGHNCRMKLPPRPQPEPQVKKPKKWPVKVVRRPKFTADTLRRVWARREFKPSHGGKTWIHNTDFGHLEYNMWEFMENPPLGPQFGLKIRKVHAFIKNELEKQILLNDRRAWVGMPVGFESQEDRKKKIEASKPDNVKYLYEVSPYSVPLFDHEQLEKEEKKEKEITKRKKAFKIHEEFQNLSSLEKLKVLGYNENYEKIESKGLDPIGTIAYDPQTGRKIVHKGNNRWVGVNDPNFVADINYPNASRINSVLDDIDRSLEEQTYSAMKSSGLIPNIFRSKSGLISVSSSKFDQDSKFLSEHKKRYSASYLETDPWSPSKEDIEEFHYRVQDDNSTGIRDQSSRISRNKSSLLPSQKTISDLLGYESRGVRKPERLPKRYSNKELLGLGVYNNPDFNIRKTTDWYKLKGGVNKISDSINQSRGLSSLLFHQLDNESNSSTSGSRAGTSSMMPSSIYPSLIKNQSSNPRFYNKSSEELSNIWRQRDIGTKYPSSLSKVQVWKKRSKPNYKLIYSWIPQPLVHNAVNNLFYEKTVKDFHKASIHHMKKEDFREQLFNESNEKRISDRILNMYQIPASATLIKSSTFDSHNDYEFEGSQTFKFTTENPSDFRYYYDDDNLIMERHDERAAPMSSSYVEKMSSESSSYEVDTERHPLRQKEILLDQEQSFASKNLASLNNEDINSLVSSVTSWDVDSKAPSQSVYSHSFTLQSKSKSSKGKSSQDGHKILDFNNSSALEKPLNYDPNIFLLEDSVNYIDSMEDVASNHYFDKSKSLSQSSSRRNKKFRFKFPKVAKSSSSTIHPYSWH